MEHFGIQSERQGEVNLGSMLECALQEDKTPRKTRKE